MPKLWMYGGIALFVAIAIAFIYYEGKDSGATKEKAKQERVNNEARKRKEAVVPADSRTTIERLRNGTF